MPIIARGGDDLLLDAMVLKLDTFRLREVALSAAVDFEITRDRSQPWKKLDKPLVNLEIDTDEPKAGDYDAGVKAYCFAPATTDDAVGAARLYYLKEQVRVALLALVSPDLGLTIGTVKIAKPRWMRIQIQDREMEQNILAGIWTFQVTYAWEVEDIAALDLTDIQVSVGPILAPLWAAAYHYGGA
jgi:hypothetical protein